MAQSLFACNNLGTALAITIINSVKNSFLLTQSPCLYLRGHTLDNWEGVDAKFFKKLKDEVLYINMEAGNL